MFKDLCFTDIITGLLLIMIGGFITYISIFSFKNHLETECLKCYKENGYVLEICKNYEDKLKEMNK